MNIEKRELDDQIPDPQKELSDAFRERFWKLLEVVNLKEIDLEKLSDGEISQSTISSFKKGTSQFLGTRIIIIIKNRIIPRANLNYLLAGEPPILLPEREKEEEVLEFLDPPVPYKDPETELAAIRAQNYQLTSILINTMKEENQRQKSEK